MSYNDLRKGRWSEPGREYLVTTVTKRRAPFFLNLKLSRLFIGELIRLECEGSCSWLAWVLMPDHFHGLLSLGSGVDLSKVMKHLKARSARAIQQQRGVTGSLWETGFHDRALRKEEQRLPVARYIIANPLRAGLVERIGDYPHWDRIWL